MRLIIGVEVEKGNAQKPNMVFYTIFGLIEGRHGRGNWTRRRPKGQDYGAARCGLRPLRAVGSIYEPEAVGAGPTLRPVSLWPISLRAGSGPGGKGERRKLGRWEDEEVRKNKSGGWGGCQIPDAGCSGAETCPPLVDPAVAGMPVS